MCLKNILPFFFFLSLTGEADSLFLSHFLNFIHFASDPPLRLGEGGLLNTRESTL